MNPPSPTPADHGGLVVARPQDLCWWHDHPSDEIHPGTRGLCRGCREELPRSVIVVSDEQRQQTALALIESDAADLRTELSRSENKIGGAGALAGALLASVAVVVTAVTALERVRTVGAVVLVSAAAVLALAGLVQLMLMTVPRLRVAGRSGTMVALARMEHDETAAAYYWAAAADPMAYLAARNKLSAGFAVRRARRTGTAVRTLLAALVVAVPAGLALVWGW